MTSHSRPMTQRSTNKQPLFIVLLLALSMFPGTARAEGGGIKLFQRQANIAGRYSAAVLIVGWTKDAADVERLIDIALDRATESAGRLDWQNPRSEVARINASAGQGPVRVSDDVVAAFQTAKRVAEWSSGAFDIVYGKGSYKNISIKEGAGTVELKNAGMQVRFDMMMEGFLAELMMRYINAAKMKNALVKVGNVFRGLGQGLTGPWKIQVQDDASTFARHALNLRVTNTGIATVSASQFRSRPLIDPRSNTAIQPTCKGVTLVMNDAGLAQGMAMAVFLLGPDKGLKLLTKLGKARALIVDQQGKFIRTPGF